MTNRITIAAALAAITVALASASVAQTVQPCDLNHRLQPNASCSNGGLVVTDPGRGVVGYKLTNPRTQPVSVRFTQVGEASFDFILGVNQTTLVGTDADFRYFVCYDSAKKPYITGTNEEPVYSTPSGGFECK